MSERESQLIRLSHSILSQSVNELARSFPPIVRAYSALTASDEYDRLLASDCKKLYFNPEELCRLYYSDSGAVTRTLLHSLLHCVCLHPLHLGNKNARLWELACDIAVENMINSARLCYAGTPRELLQLSICEELKVKLKSLTSDNLFYCFCDGDFDEGKIREYSDAFKSDSHDVWYKKRFFEFAEENEIEFTEPKSIYERAGTGFGQSFSEENRNNNAPVNTELNDEEAEKWEKINKRILFDFKAQSHRRGSSSGFDSAELSAVTRDKADYSSFLRRFIRADEALEINDDEFDYIYYTYGLKLYGNIPLIEPLEYSDNSKIKTLVIAIDTSASVKGDAVKAFVEKTYGILKTTDFFNNKSSIHILQCDAAIQDAAVIHGENELESYISGLELKGFGGTDFRPVFAYTDALVEKLSAKSVNGLIYFTDGDGEFPDYVPRYSSVFLIRDNGFDKERLPAWATALYW